MFDQFAKPHREAGVGQQAATGRRRIIRDAQPLGQCHLLLARPAAYGQELRAIDHALAFRHRLFEQLCTEWTQHVAFDVGLAVDLPHRVPPLRHRPLAEDFARHDEVCSGPSHPVCRLSQEENAAVHAWIHVLAPAEAGAFHQSEHLVVGIEHRDGNTEPGGGLDGGMFFGSVGFVVMKYGCRRKAFDLDALLKDQLDGKLTIQPSGEKGDCLWHTGTPTGQCCFHSSRARARVQAARRFALLENGRSAR